MPSADRQPRQESPVERFVLGVLLPGKQRKQRATQSYFTMLLYRRRGLKSLLWQRALRILVPCLLGLATIVPLDRWGWT
ncbi:MAG: hypothetical protein EHM42_03655 [Planctomycetaceae bacterium]|nr:MAG: hypothetical protein EHM42_03655 [Planctomycetaceae bacterium]